MARLTKVEVYAELVRAAVRGTSRSGHSGPGIRVSSPSGIGAPALSSSEHAAAEVGVGGIGATTQGPPPPRAPAGVDGPWDACIHSIRWATQRSGSMTLEPTTQAFINSLNGPPLSQLSPAAAHKVLTDLQSQPIPFAYAQIEDVVLPVGPTRRQRIR